MPPMPPGAQPKRRPPRKRERRRHQAEGPESEEEEDHGERASGSGDGRAGRPAPPQDGEEEGSPNRASENVQMEEEDDPPENVQMDEEDDPPEEALGLRCAQGTTIRADGEAAIQRGTSTLRLRNGVRRYARPPQRIAQRGA